MVKNNSVLVVLFFSLVLSFGSLCSAAESDPRKRYEECQRECSMQEQTHQPQCQQSCLKQYEQEEKQQQQEQKQHQPQRQLKECQQRCLQQEEQQRPERVERCMRQCRHEETNRSKRGKEEKEEKQSENPFYFPRRQSFEARFEEENGNFRVLQRFSEKSRLLEGIDEFRVAMIEANPNTFVLPHHCDAEKIYFVTNGKGTLTFVTEENKKSFNLVPGLVVRVPAGSTVYLVNQDDKEKLAIAVLHRPVNNPGKFEAFFPAGPQNPDQSYYRTFSQEIIETVLNTQREQLDRLFEGKQSQQGLFRRASQEQIRALSQEATSPRQKGGAKFAFNLLTQSPKYSNQNGRFFEACPREFELLRNIDVSVSASHISQGSIFVPHYNSKSTMVVLITEGEGYVEMVCPQLSEQNSHKKKESRSGGEYTKVTAGLSPGDIFVVPAGHPVTYVASQNQNLRAIAFGLRHENNQRIFIAGENNMVRRWDNEAKELSFGVPAKSVDEVFNNAHESYFVSGSQRKRRGSEESRGNDPLSSIMDFARLF